MNIELQRKTAIVTGVADHVGYAIAYALVEAGAKVALFDTDERAVEAAAEALSRYGTVRAFVVQPHEREMVDIMLRQVYEELGAVSILVQAPIGSASCEYGNVEDLVYMMCAVVKQSISDCGGAIVNFPPMTSDKVQYRTAVEQILQWSKQWRDRSVRVNVVSTESGQIPPNLAQNLADLVTFLVSDKADLISGQVLHFGTEACIR